MALAALKQWTAEDHRRDPSRLDPITFLPNRRQFLIDAGNWRSAPSTLVLVTLADVQVFNEMVCALGHARADAFIRAGAKRLSRGARGRHVDLPRRRAELRLSPARQRRAGVAGDDRPRRRRVPRAGDVRRRAVRYPHRHRAARHRPRRLEPRRGPARGARRLAGQPGRALRLDLVRPQARRGASARVPAALRPQVGAERRPPARAVLPAQGDARVGRLHQRRGAAALDPSAARPGLAGRVRRARRDHGARHADDALGDRCGDASGGDLAERGARPVGRREHLAEEPRGGRLRRVPAVLLRGAQARPRPHRARDHRRHQRRPRRRDAGAAADAARASASRSRSTTSARATAT